MRPVYLLSVAASLLLSVSAQVPIPKTRLGFPFGGCNSTAQIQWEAFLDINCPDCQAAFPIITKVAENYTKSQLCLTAYTFPLPYHRNSFPGSQAAFIVDKATNGAATFSWFKAIYDNLNPFNPYNTYEVDPDDIFKRYAQVAKSSPFGIDTDSFVKQIKSDESNEQVRLHFKFGSSRGVAATPYFFINGVYINADQTWTPDMWNQVFKNLLS